MNYNQVHFKKSKSSIYFTPMIYSDVVHKNKNILVESKISDKIFHFEFQTLILDLFKFVHYFM